MDLRTLFLAQTCALLSIAAILWVARGPADRHNGLRTWTLGVSAQGIAYMLLAAAGQLPPLLSAVLANAAGGLSVALFFVALRQFLGRPWHLPGLALMVGLVTLVAALSGSHYVASTIFNGFAYGLLQLLNARLLWRQPAPALQRIQRLVALFYLLMGLLLPLRALAMWLNAGSARYLDLPPGWQLPVYLFSFVFIIVTNLGFLHLCKARAEAEARAQALTDELTGLPNRRALDQALHEALERAARGSRAFAVMMVDVDHFKAINDRFGHHAGDHALQDFARRLSLDGRPGERVFRYGGEEFSLLLADTEAPQARQRAEQLRAQVALPPPELTRARSASFGLTHWRPGDSADALLGRADIALYRAKTLGRNRVETE
ncbi:GGDEF domain-containing protein [Roseateles sp. DAIF2]|uniref:GGDEF domain-containing protein n=1 Tax=Roseateles sp. DAIF2 TaxID=2714952 RepID=UPI0018A2AE32|nr:GGDEF domain-containing protein [Roseateles sp. DAIF2]QPF73649.1 GGDEF domain-containing protein [Roseateles sp. DAIF2]